MSPHHTIWKTFSIGIFFYHLYGWGERKIICKMRSSMSPPPPWAPQLPLSKIQVVREAYDSKFFSFSKNRWLPTPTTGPSDETNQALNFIFDQSCLSSHLKNHNFICLQYQFLLMPGTYNIKCAGDNFVHKHPIFFQKKEVKILTLPGTK